MNPPRPSTVKRRRLWPWILGLCLAPLLVLGVMVASFVTLDRDAAVLRREVMSATHSSWNTKIQLSIGHVSLTAIRTIVAFVPKMDDRAKLALRAIHGASVGIYDLKGSAGTMEISRLLREADVAMARRGYARMVAVRDHGETVLLYAPAEISSEADVDLCIAVVNGPQLVVVSTNVDAMLLADLARQQAGPEIKRSLHLAGDFGTRR